MCDASSAFFRKGWDSMGDGSFDMPYVGGSHASHTRIVMGWLSMHVCGGSGERETSFDLSTIGLMTLTAVSTTAGSR